MMVQRVLLICGLLTAGAVAAEPSAAERHFADKVEPLLITRCLSCHGPEKQEGGLRLDSRQALLHGGEHGPAAVPGDVDHSLIVKAVQHASKSLAMPPKEQLTEAEVATLSKWIADGLPWPSTITVTPDALVGSKERLGDAWSDPRNPITRIFGGQRLDLWSFKPLQQPKAPDVSDVNWRKTPIDAFIVARLKAGGLAPSPQADRRVLIRRVTYDLTGLPPTPQEVRQFIDDDSPGAYARVVDRLLASPRFGEHWARMWLDVVRYSDSNGFDWDEFRPSAWRYRDYVVRSFNSDKPFDQFVREQLAGDELIDGPPRDQAQQDCLIATGFLRLGPRDNSAALFNEQDRSRAELMNDLVETTGSAFLGLTMTCCRCHDHKFDPISQADYYRMRAFFEGVQFADDLPIDLASQQEGIRQHNQQVQEQIENLRAQQDSIADPVKDQLRVLLMQTLTDDRRRLLELPKEKITDEIKPRVEELNKKIEVDDKMLLAGFTAAQKSRYEDLSRRIDAEEKEKQSFTHALVVRDSSDIPPTKILFQGDYRQPRQAVPPGFLSALDPNPALIKGPEHAKSSGRRLAFANWIVSSQNPLTARVLVNRIWQGYFGKGLVATPNDFGFAGSRPTNPQLLDWLASDLMTNGWSLKHLHRLIVTSAVYRQSSRVDEQQKEPSVDPANEFLSHQSLRRLTAEQLRDSLLGVCGLLKERVGGPPIWPELSAEVLQANPAFLDDNAEKTKGWYPSKPEDRNVRGIYLIQKRTVRIPWMETFDLPENSVSCPRRNVATVVPQAMMLLNDPQMVQIAHAFADRVRSQAGDDPAAQVRATFELALQRSPDAAEAEQCTSWLKSHTLAEFCRVILNTNEFIYVD